VGAVIAHVKRNLVAYLALFVALGGTSYAATSLAPNSVGTPQIKNGAVTGPKLANGSVSPTKLASGVLHGLSASAFSVYGADTPPSGGNQYVVKQVKITMPQPGKLLVLDASLDAGSITNTGSSPVYYSLSVYVDGVGVPGTYDGDDLNVAGNSNQGLGGVKVGPGSLSNVAAGTHTVRLVLRTDTSSDYVDGAAGSLIVVATG
jgi:hypothetical protein